MTAPLLSTTPKKVTKSKSVKIVVLMALAVISTQAFAKEQQHTYKRIVAMSPDVADIIVALGGANKVVGKNAVNKNPALKHAKPIGTHRNLSAEAVISVKPDLALGSYMVQPQSIYQRLNGLGMTAVNVAPKEDVATFSNSIIKIGTFVGKPTQAKQLASQWQAGMTAKPANKMRYLLSYDGRYVAGKGTVGDTLIKLAGGINAGANVQGLKPLSREAWLQAKPDVIIIAKHHQKVIGSKAKFSQRPEVSVSPAGKNQNIHFWPANEFLRYGLNSPQVVTRLANLANKAQSK